MPRPKIENPKLQKKIRLRKNELKLIKETAQQFGITEQQIFEEGYKLYIKQLVERG